MSPGGFIELVDIRYPFEVDDDSLPANSALLKWANLILESSQKAGTPMNSAESYKTQLEEAGFTNVVEVQHQWPQNYWPKQQKYKELGMSEFV
jgi:hypothetical protein